ncbi:hypothetical protein EVAR_44595_1 [Eumeta japonica]|uniref:Uncharacterized protein n=1 Tax=Eumeta variegata TaxID=151549 RepID=A0A4C1XAV3_EUMVA|nr:hypothetical protein EVAR_44595_1 [Eumeta japonica]
MDPRSNIVRGAPVHSECRQSDNSECRIEIIYWAEQRPVLNANQRDAPSLIQGGRRFRRFLVGSQLICRGIGLPPRRILSWKTVGRYKSDGTRLVVITSDVAERDGLGWSRWTDLIDRWTRGHGPLSVTPDPGPYVLQF